MRLNIENTIGEVRISNEHIYSNAIRFLSCSLHFCMRFQCAVRCSEPILRELISDSHKLITGDCDNNGWSWKKSKKMIIGRGRLFGTLEYIFTELKLLIILPN